MTKSYLANAVVNSPKPAATHLALSALSALTAKHPNVRPTVESLTTEARALLPQDTSLPEEFSDAVGELWVFTVTSRDATDMMNELVLGRQQPTYRTLLRSSGD